MAWVHGSSAALFLHIETGRAAFVNPQKRENAKKKRSGRNRRRVCGAARAPDGAEPGWVAWLPQGVAPALTLGFVAGSFARFRKDSSYST